MIKLFRKISQRLLTENLHAHQDIAEQAGKFSKPTSSAGRYLIYAVGEIILLVIGILIALGIKKLVTAIILN